jgi:hypothetical protein
MKPQIHFKMIAVMCVLVLSFLLASCVFDRNALIGKWDTTSGIVVEFTDNGKIRQIPPQGLGPTTEVNYQFLSDDTILFIDSQMKFTFKVVGTTLTLDPGSGQTIITLTRSK